jgi:hypothetical protein
MFARTRFSVNVIRTLPVFLFCTTCFGHTYRQSIQKEKGHRRVFCLCGLYLVVDDAANSRSWARPARRRYAASWIENGTDARQAATSHFVMWCNFTCYRVKCTLEQVLRLCTGRTAHTGSRGIALLFHDHGTRRWGVNVAPRPLFTPKKDPVPIVQEAGWAAGPDWTGAANLAPTRTRSPDRPARSLSLYRLRHPAHMHQFVAPVKNCLPVRLNEWIQI